MQLLCILGRQPAIGLAELESRFGPADFQPLNNDIAQLETDQDIAVFTQIGSTQKVAKLLTYLDTTDWNKALRAVQKSLPDHLQYIPEGKVTIGLSTYGFNASAQQVNAAALSLKKVIKQAGRSARVVPNAEATLNTAQVIHNKLTSPNGLELMLVRDKNRTVLAQTVWVQDIDAYRQRDQERPMRDARIGMLPPKLAQIILNLAVGDLEQDEISVLDPFCGTGVLLQEAYLSGYRTIGSDLDPRMVDYTTKNLLWLEDTVMRGNPQPRRVGVRTLAEKDSIFKPTVKPGDATSMTWSEPFDTIAAETYLGRALSSMPDHETLQKIINDCDTIHTKFLKNVARQTKPGFRMCIAIPAWSTARGFKHLKTLDNLEQLGYNRVKFVHAKNEDLIYHRPGQIVARELVILTRR